MAATAPQIDMAMIGRVLASAQKSKAQAFVSERQRLASLTTRQQTGPVPTPGLIRRDDESDAELIDRWANLVGALPDDLQAVINMEAEGLDMPEIAAELAVPLVTVWDRALEATAAILEAAGLPVVNRWLEAKLKQFDLLPAGTAPFTCDFGWVLRHLPRRLREGTYARISCRGIDVLAVWGMKVPTYHQRWPAAKRTLRFCAQVFGAFRPSQPLTAVPGWEISATLGIGSDQVNRAAQRLGLGWGGPYTWDQIPVIWRAVVTAPAYQVQL